MSLLIVFVALEMLAVVAVVALCMAARRGDAKTAHALDADETPTPSSRSATPAGPARARPSVRRRIGALFRRNGHGTPSD
jgi:hypothetical protein